MRHKKKAGELIKNVLDDNDFKPLKDLLIDQVVDVTTDVVINAALGSSNLILAQLLSTTGLKSLSANQAFKIFTRVKAAKYIGNGFAKAKGEFKDFLKEVDESDNKIDKNTDKELKAKFGNDAPQIIDDKKIVDDKDKKVRIKRRTKAEYTEIKEGLIDVVNSTLSKDKYGSIAFNMQGYADDIGITRATVQRWLKDSGLFTMSRPYKGITQITRL